MPRSPTVKARRAADYGRSGGRDAAVESQRRRNQPRAPVLPVVAPRPTADSGLTLIGRTLMHAAAPLPGWITPAQYAALTRVVTALAVLDLPYVVSGGLAGNLHGSQWPLHDLDFDVPGAALPRLAAHFVDAVRFGPGPYRDAELELDLLVLTIDGVEVDLTAAETVTLRRPSGERMPWPTDLARSDVSTVGTLAVRVMTLADLLAYKRIVGRVPDVRDLEALHTAPSPLRRAR